MPTVAEQLRAARETKKLTIEQVAEATKIRTDHIRAIEEGNFNVFPAPVYIRGTVRIYATLLKLDLPTLFAALDEELGRTKRYSEPPPLTEQKKTVVDAITLWLAKLNWKMGFAGIGIILGIIVLISIVLAWRHHQHADPTRNLRPAVYQPAGPGDSLALPRH